MTGDVLLPSENRGVSQDTMDATLSLTNFFYGRNKFLADYESDWSLRASYVIDHSAVRVIAVLRDDGSVRDYFTVDGQRCTRELVEGAGNVRTRYSYDVWGVPAQSRLSGDATTRFRAPGGLYSDTAGLDPGDPWFGPPAWGSNEESGDHCTGAMCGNYGFSPYPWMGGDIQEDWRVDGFNVCASLTGVHHEWNSLWYAAPVRSPRWVWKPFGMILCWSCRYTAAFINPYLNESGEEDFRLPSEQDPAGPDTNVVREGEPCPMFVPYFYAALTLGISQSWVESIRSGIAATVPTED